MDRANWSGHINVNLFPEHEFRRLVVEELHLRRWPRLSPPCQIIQFVRVLDQAERPDENAALRLMPGDAVYDCRRDRHMAGSFADGVMFTWERHSEASTTTLFVPDGADGLPSTLLSCEKLSAPLQWALQLPGKIIRATRLLIVENEEQASGLVANLAFDERELVSCQVGCEGHAPVTRIWSDFQVRDDGFGLAVIASNGLNPSDLGRLIQRFQELGNYRNLALLGLPVARRGWQELDCIEAELNSLTQQIADIAVADDDLPPPSGPIGLLVD